MICMTIRFRQVNHQRLKEQNIDTSLATLSPNLGISMSKEIGKDEAVAISLSDKEMDEIRQIIAKANEEEAKAARSEYYEKVSSLRADAKWTLKSLLDKCLPLKEYRDAEYRGYENLRLASGEQIGFGWAGHMSGAADYFQKTFEFWGFEGLDGLYSLPKEMRNEFLDKGREFVESIFGKDLEGLHKLLSAVDQEEDLLQLKLLQLKGEGMTTETECALKAIADIVKGKAEAGEQQRVQKRLMKRLAGALLARGVHF